MQTVRTTLNREYAESLARQSQEPPVLRALRAQARHDLEAEAVGLLVWLRARERLAQIETEVSEAQDRIARLASKRAEAWEAMKAADADLRERNRATNVDGAPYDREKCKALERQRRSATQRRTSLGDSLARAKDHIADLQAEAEVLSAIERPATPALEMLRDAID